jgi:hypothetical protein
MGFALLEMIPIWSFVLSDDTPALDFDLGSWLAGVSFAIFAVAAVFLVGGVATLSRRRFGPVLLMVGYGTLTAITLFRIVAYRSMSASIDIPAMALMLWLAFRVWRTDRSERCELGDATPTGRSRRLFSRRGAVSGLPAV